MRRVSAITIDLWDTIIQEHPGGSDKVAQARIKRMGDLLARGGVVHSPGELARAYARTGDFLDMTWSKRRDMQTMDQVLFMLSCLDDKLAGKLERRVLVDLKDAYSEGILSNPPMLLPGAKDALSTLKERGYKLALISNTGRTPGSMLRIVLKDLGIAEHFDVMTFSNEILIRKPAESAFRLTLEKLKSTPKVSVHVGDDPEADIAGAHAIGMRSVQVLRQGAKRSPLADRCVKSLNEVADCIEGI